MLIAALLAVLAGALGLMRRGSLDSLARTHFHWLPYLAVGLGIQILYAILPLEDLSETRARVVILLSYGMVVAFMIANRSLPGMILAAIGLVLNIAVIAANGAMPVSVDAAEVAGVSTSFENAGVKHEELTNDTLLPWLGDVLPIPGVHEVISIGDVLLALGIAWLIYARVTAEVSAKLPIDRLQRGAHRR